MRATERFRHRFGSWGARVPDGGRRTERVAARRGAAGILVIAGGLSLAACATTSTPILGLYVDNPTPAHVAAVASSLGVPDEAASGYTGGTSWAGIASYTPFSGARDPQGYRLLLSVAMCPSPGGNLEAVPTHLGTFRTLARHLVAGGQGDAIIRLGEEANGNSPGGPHSGFSWVTADSGLFKSDFREIVTTMRSVPGSHFLFDFNVNDAFTFPWPNGARGTSGFNDYYPGDDYVDVISDDFYENGYPTRYVGNVTGVIDEAIAHHKPWALPEWGLNGSDEPQYIKTMTSLIRGTFPRPHGGTYPAPLYESYFDTAASTLGPSVPRSRSALRTDLAGAG
jgi:hypothetical protein